MLKLLCNFLHLIYCIKNLILKIRLIKKSTTGCIHKGKLNPIMFGREYMDKEVDRIEQDKNNNYGRQIDEFTQANLFISVELKLPIPIPDGEVPEGKRAMNYLEDISSGLIRGDNSFICIDNGNIVYLKMIPPEKFNIRRGDIVKPVPIMEGDEPSYLLKRFDWAINFDYPEGYYVALTNPDEEGEIIVESLLTGKRRCDSIKAWIKIGYAGINLLEGEEEV